jgi:hypothetical protein
MLYDVYLRPNSSNRPIKTRPMIDVEPWRRFSLEMDPFEYCPIK